MVRYAKDSDLRFLKDTWQICFGDDQKFIDWNFSRNYQPENTLIAEKEESPAAAMQFTPYRLRLGGRDYSANYVAGVGTLPQFRKQGLMREMFAFALPEMHRRGQAVSLLIPARRGLYEPLGYSHCFHRFQRTIDALPPGQTRYARDYTPALADTLYAIYRRAMEGMDCFLLYSEAQWQFLLEDFLFQAGGGIWLSETPAPADHSAGTVSSPGTLQHSDELQSFALFLQQKGRFALYALHGRCPVPQYLKGEPFAMARIIDVPLVLSHLAENFAGRLRIQVTDPYIPENNLCVQIADGRLIPCEAPELSLDIETLSALVFGRYDDPTHGLFPRRKSHINLFSYYMDFD